MSTIALAGHAAVAVNLNQPDTYLHWNVFTISVANLVLIAVMVAIFGRAAAAVPAAARRPAAGGRQPRPTSAAYAPRRGMSGCGRRGCAAGR